MIVIDPIFSTAPFTRASTPRCFRNTLACHMMSTLGGKEGCQELITFARRLGLRPDWIQYPNSSRQHFDLTSANRLLALKLGAVEVPRGWLPGDPI